MSFNLHFNLQIEMPKCKSRSEMGLLNTLQNEKCEVLMEHAACSHVRDHAVNVQAAYANLYTTVQGLLSKTEKSVSDFTDFNRMKAEFDEWFQLANGTAQDAASGTGTVPGTPVGIKERVDQLKNVTARMTEGQHHLNCLTEAFSALLSMTSDSEVDKIRSTVNEAKLDYETLSNFLSKNLLALQEVYQKSEDLRANVKSLDKWLSDIKIVLEEPFNSLGELCEMKTILEKYRNISGEMAKREDELRALESSANDLPGHDSDVTLIAELQRELGSQKITCDKLMASTGKEIEDNNSYSQSLQEVEKWLLQMNFQLMAHNSLYITSRDQTEEQVEHHEDLMGQIRGHQLTLDAVREEGSARVARYVRERPEMKRRIEKQHQNFQESYNSLLQTGTQIKNRLADSMAKFQEYEDALDNIAKNLEALEPKIKGDSEEIENLNVQDEFESMRAIHNRLQAEKALLQTAVQACEMASASISRPGTPIKDDSDANAAPAREVGIKLKLEELIDRVEGRMTELGSQVTEMEGVQKTKEALDAWIANQGHYSVLS